METRVRSVFVVLCSLLSGCAIFQPSGPEGGFITVEGTHFIHDGRPYYFAGTNLWYGGYLGAPGVRGDRSRLIRELDSLQALGVDNLRVLAGSESSTVGRSVTPATTQSPGHYDESLLEGLDFLLAEMAKRDMKAVLYLTNYWEWSGGMAQYVTWADSTKKVDPDRDGWGAFMDHAASMYSDTIANEMFRQYIKVIITRVNTLTGRRYADDPAIMAWQLANEPRPGSSVERAGGNVPSYVRWIDETAGFIRSLDTNHLVSTGSEGLAGSLDSEAIFIAAHTSRNIDYLTAHCWVFNWRIYDPQRPEETLPKAVRFARDYIDEHIALGRRLNKPVVLEEFGLGRDGNAADPSVMTVFRDRYYGTIFDLIADSASAGSPIAGCNFWAWGGEGKALHDDHWWRPGDPFTGDPPQEPQGLNSVFETDASTKALIRNFAIAMRRLRMMR